MKKRIAIILFLMLLIPVVCFAADPTPYLIQLPYCFVVDLASEMYHTHDFGNTESGWEDGTGVATKHDTVKYYEKQILAVVGVNGTRSTSNDIEFTLTLLSGEWCYILNENDIRYKRPFGLDVFARGKRNNEKDSDIKGYSLYLGNQANAPANVSNTVKIPASVAGTYNAIWWDVSLVLDCDESKDNDIVNDTITYNDTTYNLTASESYYTATIQVSVKCGSINSTYILVLEGYYNPSSTVTSTNCQMHVTPLATANTIDIRSLHDNSDGSHVVATYSFTTNTAKKKLEGNYAVYLFLSSSRDTNAEKFTLRHVGTNGTVSARDTNYNSLNFIATITSTNGTINGGTAKTSEYDGTDYYGKSGTAAKYIVIGPEYGDAQDTTTTRWHDEGTISVSIPNTEDISNLVSGQYTSNIYVHVVTDLPSF